MTDLNHLLDQIDRLDEELSKPVGHDQISLVESAETEWEFHALARTALPKLAAVIRRLRECAQTLTEDNNDASDYASGIHEAVECLEHIIKDALGDDDA